MLDCRSKLSIFLGSAYSSFVCQGERRGFKSTRPLQSPSNPSFLAPCQHEAIGFILQGEVIGGASVDWWPGDARGHDRRLGLAPARRQREGNRHKPEVGVVVGALNVLDHRLLGRAQQGRDLGKPDTGSDCLMMAEEGTHIGHSSPGGDKSLLRHPRAHDLPGGGHGRVEEEVDGTTALAGP